MSDDALVLRPSLLLTPPETTAMRQRLILNDDGKLVRTPINASTILNYDARWQGRARIVYDTLAQRIRCESPPWHPDDAPATPCDEWSDEDTTRLDLWMRRYWKLDLPIERYRAIVNLVARSNEVDPRRHWLDSLVWDGTSRVATWLTVYAGAEPTPYVGSVGRKWMLSAVARAFEPGCKVDTLMVLEGAQGKGKSTLLRTLVPVASWFSDTPIDLASKDAYVALRGRWVIELAELASLRKPDLDRMKAFFSSPIDSYRPPYGREQITVPRTAVFAGTVNSDDYLNDSTGARRFWPIKVGDIDLGKLAEDRDQLWSEAVHIYKDWVRRGSPSDECLWWPSPEELSTFEAEQNARQTEDAWTPIVRSWLNSEQAASILARYGGVMAYDVLTHAIGLVPKEMSQLHLRRAANVLKWLGYHNRQVSRGNVKRRHWEPSDRLQSIPVQTGEESVPQIPLQY